eukprot:1259906-Rhodomonas_salina.2
MRPALQLGNRERRFVPEVRRRVECDAEEARARRAGATDGVGGVWERRVVELGPGHAAFGGPLVALPTQTLHRQAVAERFEFPRLSV